MIRTGQECVHCWYTQGGYLLSLLGKKACLCSRAAVMTGVKHMTQNHTTPICTQFLYYRNYKQIAHTEIILKLVKVVLSTTYTLIKSSTKHKLWRIWLNWGPVGGGGGGSSVYCYCFSPLTRYWLLLTTSLNSKVETLEILWGQYMIHLVLHPVYANRK